MKKLGLTHGDTKPGITDINFLHPLVLRAGKGAVIYVHHKGKMFFC